MDGIWTNDRTEQLKGLWAAGLSCSEIATELNCFSYCHDGGRNAVISKIHRLKLPDPQTKRAPLEKRLRTKPPKSRRPPRRRNPWRNVITAIAIAANEPGLPEKLKGPVPDGTGIKLGELTDLTCRWPIGDPKTPEFEFCGARAVPDTPYCAGHCGLAYQPPYCRYRADKALVST